LPVWILVTERVRRRPAILLVMLLLGAAAAGGAAFRQAQAAVRAAAQAAAREPLTKASALSGLDPRASLLLSLGAMTESPSSDARASLVTSLSQSRHLGRLTAPLGVYASRFSRHHGTALAAAIDGGDARLRDVGNPAFGGDDGAAVTLGHY
jgi:hypothetical protein